MWSDLAYPWRVCFEEAWEAWKVGCIPIGAAIIDKESNLIARGRNRIFDTVPTEKQINGNFLAHAELNTFLQMKSEDEEFRHACTLYTLVEPCPLCFGALYMSGVRKAYYACKDPLAGSADLLGKTPYLSRKPIRIKQWEDSELERVVHALQIAFYCDINQERYAVAMKAYDLSNPDSTNFGKYLQKTQWLNLMKEQQANAKSLYENLIFMYFEKFKKEKA